MHIRFCLACLTLASVFSFSVNAGFLPPNDVDAPPNSPTGEGGYPLEITSKVISGYKLHLVGTTAIQMGSTDGDADEKPVHSAQLPNPVYVGICPISNGQYEGLPDANDPETQSKRNRGQYSKDDKSPAARITCNDAESYIARVIEAATSMQPQPAPSYFLPSEVEWEVAARENGSAKYPWGDDITEQDKNFYSKSQAQAVDLNIRSNLVFFHMTGNVFGWCSDMYSKDYASAPGTKTRSLRGGKWYSYDKSLRCADRWNAFPETRSDFIGFRICRDVSGFVITP